MKELERMSVAPQPPQGGILLDYGRTSDAAPIGPRASSLRQFVTMLLLAAGAQVWIGLGRAELGGRRQFVAGLLALIAAIVISIVPAWRARVHQLSERLEAGAGRGKAYKAVVITLLSCAYLFITARGQGRDFAPILHDEYAYVLQAKMLASGHLWMPAHELGDFFESFHLLTDGVYAAKYGPGTAMFFAPAALLHLPPWVTPLLLSGVVVGLFYLLAAELFGEGSGWLAALMLISLGAFRRTSVMMMSQAPVLVLALAAMLTFVYWRRTRRGAWMVVLGAAIGWAAITRPVDALCVALPLAVAVLVELWRADNRARVRAIALGLAGVAPFALLQVVYNKGVTGSATTLPWVHYAKLYDPYDTMGKRPLDTKLMQLPLLAQKQAIIDDFTKPAFQAKARQGLRTRLADRTTRLLVGPPMEEQEAGKYVYGAVPSPLLVALLPVGLIGVLDRRRWMFWAPLPLFILIYANYSYYFSHYTVAVLPATLLMVLGAIDVLRRTWPRLAGPVGLALGLLIVAVSVAALPQVNPLRHDQWIDAPLLRDVDAKLAKLEHTPAVVLFKYDPDRMIHEEPVYNVETAWPDDAKVIRAHDLGPERNGELFVYFAKRSPGRAVYRYDEKTRALSYLGTVEELARAATTRPASGPAKLGS